MLVGVILLKLFLAEAVSQNVLEKVPFVNEITTADYPTQAKRPANTCLDLTKNSASVWS